MTQNLVFTERMRQEICRWQLIHPFPKNSQTRLSRYQISKYITYVSSDFNVKADKEIRVKYENPIIIFAHCLKGHNSFKFENSNNYFDINEGETWLINLNNSEGLVRKLLPKIHTQMKIIKYDFNHIRPYLDNSLKEKLEKPFFLQINKDIKCEKWLQLLSEKETECMKDRLKTESRAIELLAESLNYLSIGIVDRSSNNYSFIVDKIIAKIESNLMSIPTLKELEEEFHMSHTKINKLFKKVKGETVFSFYRKLRLEHAVLLLQDENLTSTQISQICGFSSSSHFTESFKKVYKITPSQYRKKLDVQVFLLP